jgi:hypothetical protein
MLLVHVGVKIICGIFHFLHIFPLYSKPPMVFIGCSNITTDCAEGRVLELFLRVEIFTVCPLGGKEIFSPPKKCQHWE